MMPRWLVLISASLLVFSGALAGLHVNRKAGAEASAAPSRTFEFNYQVQVPASATGGMGHLWVPLPRSDAYQNVRNLRIESTARHAIGRDPEYGNPYAVFTPTPEQAAAGYDVLLRFEALRREHRVFLSGAVPRSVSTTVPLDPIPERYLQADRLVPLNGMIAELAEKNTAGATTPLERARRIYDYVLATMRYDKSGEGWGHGDAIWACTAKRGNCTDFHALFIGMMRASGIPARFEIGFPLPKDKTAGDIAGYHCWAEFYLQDLGWVPVDASEAWINPSKRDYFFGAHDANRVLFTYGRDIRLSTEQKGEPINYFIYPYAEIDGQVVTDLKTHFAFRDLSSSQPFVAETR
jgi:transglutaminase-like putative cysteine protease